MARLSGDHDGHGRAGRHLIRSVGDRAARVGRALTGGDQRAYRDSLVALTIAGITSLVAGVTLALTTDTLEELPGLLLLVPAALAVKGNVFGALGSRLGTSIHAGTFRLSARLDTIVGANVAAAMLLSLVIAVIIAMLAKGVAIAFSISPTMSVADFIVVSALGGVLASVLILVITLLLAAGSVRFGWDLDNVVSPLVTASSDVASLPSLVLAAQLASIDGVTPVLAWIAVVTSGLALLWALLTRVALLRTIVRESLPILVVAGLLDLIAGITIEKRLDDFLEFPVLLVLLPGFLGTAGALGGVLSSRLATKLHLGLIEPGPIPRGSAGSEVAMIFSLSIPVFVIAGLIAELGGVLANQASPGVVDLVLVSVTGGLLATACVVVVAYYATVVAVRFGLDPDTYGIPMVTSTLDFVGAFALILAIVAFGVA
ncbi:MAG: divalent cation transporter [Acidimicrobiales bacterium]|nr:MAG: divalent cation transporter [Acidimicrobiales bacterium]